MKFHNGNDFTADDVLVSLDRIRLPASNMTFVVNSIEKIDKVDDHTIDIVTKYPDPTLLLNLPNFWIMDKEWLEANNAFGLEEGATVKTFANLNVNGTGPFMLEEWVPDTRTVLVPNPNWWGTPGHNLTKAVFTPIGNAATRVAALLSGEIDLMYPVPLQDVPRLESTAGVEALQGPELRNHLPRLRPASRRAARHAGLGQEPVQGRAGAQGLLPGHRHQRHQARGDAQRVDPHRAHDRTGDQRVPAGHERPVPA